MLETLKTPELIKGDAEQKREEIRRYFHNSWNQYEALFAGLADDTVFYQRPEPLRHPLIFYYGHTATFYINKLVVSKIIDQRIDPAMESMMAIGVDEMSWDDLDESHYDWPPVQAVRAYREQVRHCVDALIQTLPLQLPIDWEDPFWIILMGIEHERIHLETSSVLIRQLPLDAVRPRQNWPVCEWTGPAPENRLLPVSAGKVEQGRSRPASTYGWDNEYGQKITEVPAFRAAEMLVSNGEFLAFVEEGGYEDAQWWSEEGWQWRQFRQAAHPVFWIRDGQQWRYRALFQAMEMPWNWPVDVNFHEAKAFCNWLSARTGKPLRLPSEAEWYRLYEENMHEHYPHWERAPANVDLAWWASACPVNHFRHGDFYDVVGNVWQWTETAIDGFEGFAVHPAYDDFSVPTFDGQHNLIKGGSFISTGNEAHHDSRYAFRRHFYQHAGFRYVESSQVVEQNFNTYETDILIAQYLEFHYGETYFGVPNFPQSCIARVAKQLAGQRLERVLDIGCAVGRSSFELARIAKHVDAVDFSTRFIRNALQLREYGQLRYWIPEEGELQTLRAIKLEQLGLAGAAQRVHFSQGDACNLKPVYDDYDLVFAGNLIDRLYEPKRFLQLIQARIRPGGWLVLTSPYTWLEEFTEKAHWLGGFKVDGENRTSLDGLRLCLQPAFELVAEPEDIPFVIRETARKYQHTLAQMTIWRKCSE